MRIKKQYSNAVPNGKILNMSSTSQTDTYSCKKIEDKFDEEVGELSNLGTTDKSNIVNALNEVNSLKLKSIEKTFSNMTSDPYWSNNRIKIPISSIGVDYKKVVSIVVNSFSGMGSILNILVDANYLSIITDSVVNNSGNVTINIWYID